MLLLLYYNFHCSFEQQNSFNYPLLSTAAAAAAAATTTIITTTTATATTIFMAIIQYNLH